MKQIVPQTSQGYKVGTTLSRHNPTQNDQVNADAIAIANEFKRFLANLPESIDHLQDQYGQKYPNYITQGYERIVSFIKKHQDQLKVAADRDQLHKILSDIFEKEGNEIQKRLAQDATALTKFPELELLKSNSLANQIRIYLRNFNRRKGPTSEFYRMKLANFYEDNKQLFDPLCNFVSLFSN